MTIREPGDQFWRVQFQGRAGPIVAGFHVREGRVTCVPPVLASWIGQEFDAIRKSRHRKGHQFDLIWEEAARE